MLRQASSLVRLTDVRLVPNACSLGVMERFEEQVRRLFAERLRRARKDAGYRHAVEFAHALSVEVHTYRAWERGTHLPDLPTTTRICKLLDVEPNDLLPLALKQKGARAAGAAPKGSDRDAA